MTEYKGEDRREGCSAEAYCEQHMEFVKNIAEIKTTLDDIRDGIKQGISFKNGVIICLVTQMVVIGLSSWSFANTVGKMENQVAVNTSRLAVIENSLFKVSDMR